MVPEQITHEAVINAPPERVWAMLTQAEHIRAWFAFDGATIDLRPGGELVMTWKEHGTFHTRIEEVDPPRRFAYRWAHVSGEQPRDGNSTLVEFTLNAEDSATRLLVVESGFRELDLSDEERAELVNANVQGWSGGFTALQEYAKKHHDVDAVPDRIERDIFIAAPAETVWSVLTEAEHIGKGSPDFTAEVDLRPGGAMVLRWVEYGTFIFRIERVEPPRFYSFRWARPTHVEPRLGNSTLVEFTLTPEENGTRLRVVESGFRELDLTDEEKLAWADGNVAGWDGQLTEIRDYAERLAASLPR
jgi:uncharacterized protein YndB with AHSA1/START domain